MERIYWPLRQLRYTSRSLALFLGQSLALNTRDLCVSRSFGWQLWAKHSSIDLHICNFEEVGTTPVYHFFPSPSFLILEILEMRHAKHRRGRLIILAVYLHGFFPSDMLLFSFPKSGKRTRRKGVEGWRTARVSKIISRNLMDSLYITVCLNIHAYGGAPWDD